VKLTRKEALLVLRSAASEVKRVEIVPSLSEALLGWNGRDRVSPILEIETPRSATAFQFKPGAASLFFMGPANPALADGCMPRLTGKSDRAWLTFGLFNLVFYTGSRAVERYLVAWARRHRVRWEQWELRGTELKRDTHSESTNGRPDDLLRSLNDFRFRAPLPELRDAGEEYCALLAAAACRSYDVDPLITQELEQTNAIITKSALKHASETNRRGLPAIALLVDANAALSRFTSQMFSGIPRICETECHFWTHSLLGTGVAHLALLKIRRFITLTLGEARIPDQIKLLEGIADEGLIKDVLEDGLSWSGP
jgi:hypothetical protein